MLQKMENNDILSRLMADGQPNTSTVTTEPLVSSVQDQDLGLSTARVISVRYKLLSLILLVLGIVVFLYAVIPSRDALQIVRSELATQNQTIDDFEAKKQ